MFTFLAGLVVSVLVGASIVDILVPHSSVPSKSVAVANAAAVPAPLPPFPVPAAQPAPSHASAELALSAPPLPPTPMDQDSKSLQVVASWLQDNANANTVKAYNSAWGMFKWFCDEQKLQSLPASPVTVARWIAFLTDRGYTASTISSYLAGVVHVHVMNGLPNPCMDPMVAKVKRVSSSIAPPSVGRSAFSAAELDAIATYLDSDDVRVRWDSVRDGCLLFLSVLGLLRGSELVALKWQDVQFQWVEDNVKNPTYTPAAIVINVARSKTDQAGVGSTVPIQANWESKWCAVRWLTRWEEVLSNFGKRVRGDAWVFPNMTKDSSNSPIARATVSKRFKMLAEAIDVKSSSVGSHSGRKTGATQMVLSGVSLLDLKQHGRWKSNAVERYFVPSLFDRLRATAKVFEEADGL